MLIDRMRNNDTMCKRLYVGKFPVRSDTVPATEKRIFYEGINANRRSQSSFVRASR